MINCTLYQAQQAQTVTLSELAALRAQPKNFLWVRVDSPEIDELHQLQQIFELHELAIEDASSAKQRAKLETYGDILFIVLHSGHWQNNSLALGEVHLFLGKNFLISVHHNSGLNTVDINKRIHLLPSKLKFTPATAMYILLDSIVDNASELLGLLRAQFQTLESAMFSENLSRKRLEKSYQLKRQLLLLSEASEPVIDICDNLIRLHDEHIPKNLKAYLRDVQDHTMRVVKTSDNLREMLMSAMQVNLALVSIGQNDTSKKLTGWAAIFAIPTVVFGLYGMNFEHMPELQWRYGYFAVLGGTALICGLVYRRLKKIGWL